MIRTNCSVVALALSAPSGGGGDGGHREGSDSANRPRHRRESAHGTRAQPAPGIVPPVSRPRLPDLRSASTPSPTRAYGMCSSCRRRAHSSLRRAAPACAAAWSDWSWRREYPEIAVALIGDSRADCISALRTCACAAGVGSRLHLVPAVDPEQVVPIARAADVGIVAYRDTGLSSRTTLPNKLFEYLAAGLPVVASRLPRWHGLSGARRWRHLRSRRSGRFGRRDPSGRRGARAPPGAETKCCARLEGVQLGAGGTEVPPDRRAAKRAIPRVIAS